MTDDKTDPTTEAQTDAVEATEQALADTEQAAEAVSEAAGAAEGRNVDLPNFQQVLADVEASGLDLLHDVELNVKIELGRTQMLVEDVLRLNEGSVVELDKLAGDPVDIYVNERLVARGEVLVLNDNFSIRISEIIGSVEADAGDQDAATEGDSPAQPSEDGEPEPAQAGAETTG